MLNEGGHLTHGIYMGGSSVSGVGTFSFGWLLKGEPKGTPLSFSFIFFFWGGVPPKNNTPHNSLVGTGPFLFLFFVVVCVCVAQNLKGRVMQA